MTFVSSIWKKNISTPAVFSLKNSLGLQQFWLFSSFKYLNSHFYNISSYGKWIQAFYPFGSSLDLGCLFRCDFCWFLFLSIMLVFLLGALVEMSDGCFFCKLVCRPGTITVIYSCELLALVKIMWNLLTSKCTGIFFSFLCMLWFLKVKEVLEDHIKLVAQRGLCKVRSSKLLAFNLGFVATFWGIHKK